MKIPRILDERVEEKMLPNVGFDVEAGDFGQKNIQRMQSATEGAIGGLEKIAIKAQREADQTVQLEAGTRLSNFELEQNRKIRETQGKNALGLADQFEKDWETFSSDIKNSLIRNDSQRMMVDRLMSSTYAQLRNNIDSHTSREMESFYDSQAEAMIESDRMTAIDSLDPMRVAESIGKQKAILQQIADRKGWSKEELEVKSLEAERDTKTEYIQRVADSDTTAAQAMIDDEEEKKILGSDNVYTLQNYIIRRNRQNALVEKENIINNDIKFMNDFSSGKITDINSIMKLNASGVVSSEVAKAAVAYMSDPDIIIEQDTPAFAKFAEAAFELNDKDSIQTLFYDTLSGGADGKPNMQEINSLVKIIGMRSKVLTLKDNEVKEEPKKKNFIVNAFEAVKGWADSFGKDTDEYLKTELYKDLFNEIETKEPATAEEAQTVAAKVIENGQSKVNPNRTAYKIDQVITAPNGVVGKIIGFDEDGEPLVDWNRK